MFSEILYPDVEVIVFLSGKPGCGKDAAAQFLEQFGYQEVNTKRYLEKLPKGFDPSTHELAEDEKVAEALTLHLVPSARLTINMARSRGQVLWWRRHASRAVFYNVELDVSDDTSFKRIRHRTATEGPRPDDPVAARRLVKAAEYLPQVRKALRPLSHTRVIDAEMPLVAVQSAIAGNFRDDPFVPSRSWINK